MPPIDGHQKLAGAVFSAIDEGSYATDQDVASAELSSAALESLSSQLEQARIIVKNSISELSRLSATDIDGWIVQAKQLRQDINQTERKSQAIVQFAKDGRALREKLQDASAKVKLLDGEVVFNDSVVDTLRELQNVRTTTDATSAAIEHGQLVEASKSLKQSEVQASRIGSLVGTGLIGVIRERIEKIRSKVIDIVEETWSKLIVVDSSTHRLTIHTQVEGSISLEQLAQALDILELLQEKIAVLNGSVDRTILIPLLLSTSGTSCNITVKDLDTIEVGKSSSIGSTETIFKSIETLQSFFRDHLPQPVQASFFVKLNEKIVEILVSSTLAAVVPMDLSGLPTFQQTIEQVKSFATSLDKGSSQILLEWAEDAPNIWLAKRSEGSLNSIRQLLKRGLGRPRQVERVETQVVTQDDKVFSSNGNQEDWDTNWSDEDEQMKSQIKAPQKNRTPTVEEDDDMSGWGFDEDDDEVQSKVPDEAIKSSKKKNLNDEDDDDGEAWGWGDDPAVTKPTTRTSKPQEREITLRETYHITSLPEQILDIIVMIIEDANSLSHANSSNHIASAAKGLHKLPGALLSMFRASAPNFYGNDINGSMFLYNDCLYLSEQIRSYIKHQARQSDVTLLSTLIGTDIPDLEMYGKRAYGKEMESKRTTLIDLLDGAQGFSNCTEEPFASQCDLAIRSVVDFLRQTHGQWNQVLSRSALFQSIGSLLTSITTKMIVDIEDMTYISEQESQKLVSFCQKITALEDVFLPDTNDGTIPLTAGYTKTWLRFQYLSNILESSLADIKYLWIEGELSMEFTVDEVIDLIDALFADSDHRRRAIAEIRQTL